MCWFCNLTAFLSPPKNSWFTYSSPKKWTLQNSEKNVWLLSDVWLPWLYSKAHPQLYESRKFMSKTLFSIVWPFVTEMFGPGKTLLHQYQKCCICYISLSWCMFQSWSMILSITHPNEALLKVIYGRFYTQISRFTLPHCCPNKTH